MFPTRLSHATRHRISIRAKKTAQEPRTKMQHTIPHTQELFESLQITDVASADSGAWQLSSVFSPFHCRHFGESPSSAQPKMETEMAKLLEMAASMRFASRTEKKTTTQLTKIDLPAPVRYSRANNRKMASVKGPSTLVDY